MPFNEVDRVYIDANDREKYNDKTGLGSLSPFFAQKSNSDLFLFAIAYALKNGLPRKPLASRDGYFRTDYLKEVDEVLLKSLAVYDKKSIDVLENEKEILQIAEEYANAGIKVLYKDLKNRSGNYQLEIEEYLAEIDIPR
ncbi:hypothetical protein [Methanorbis furvi]|uniref:Uncharacterized protein n=1 Tax=Methanorbis furvi TaxID=3028299 RepID=A0AAE4S9Y4_9EURY|nr:hypothetical protein [Methanocorpusculaceae archaeon Ag1]